MLLITRFKEISRFTALCADRLQVGLFLVYQFPFILPIAIPISGLIASFLLFQRLSRSHELTALRACGLSLFSISAPLLLLSACLSILNFSLCAEIAPFCRREARALLYKETSENPLLLLQRQNLIQFKNMYVNMKVGPDPTSAKDFLLIVPNENNERLSLFAARSLELEGRELKSMDLALLSHLPSDLPSDASFDTLVIENQAAMKTFAPALSSAMKKNRPRFETAALNLKMLRLKALEGRKAARSAHFEILRRISLSFSAFSFTFLGCAFGIEQGRSPSKKNLFLAFFLTLTALLCYLLGKEWKSAIAIAYLLFLLPHALIGWFCLRKMRRISRGLS